MRTAIAVLQGVAQTMARHTPRADVDRNSRPDQEHGGRMELSFAALVLIATSVLVTLPSPK